MKRNLFPALAGLVTGISIFLTCVILWEELDEDQSPETVAVRYVAKSDAGAPDARAASEPVQPDSPSGELSPQPDAAEPCTAAARHGIAFPETRVRAHFQGAACSGPHWVRMRIRVRRSRNAMAEYSAEIVIDGERDPSAARDVEARFLVFDQLRATALDPGDLAMETAAEALEGVFRQRYWRRSCVLGISVEPPRWLHLGYVRASAATAGWGPCAPVFPGGTAIPEMPGGTIRL